MIEFYNEYFKSSYNSKVSQLIKDIDRLLDLENINLIKDNDIVLNPKYQRKLDGSTWIKVNQQYNTLYSNEHKISSTLNKFINKTEKYSGTGYKFIDTFAGCGGLSLGLKKAGFSPVLINEIEPKFLETYYFNYNLHLSNYFCGDIKDIAHDHRIREKFKSIDLIVGGPPCQGFSMANRQRLIDDPRNSLYKYFLEFLGNLRPKFFVMENVKGMLNKSQEILDNFKSILGEDYSIEMVLLNAKHYGVPQNRERVFVIGSRIRKIEAKQIVEDIMLSQESEEAVLKDALYGLPELEPKRKKNARGLENDNIGFKFRKNDFPNNDFLININGSEQAKYLCNHINRYNNDRDIEIYRRLPQGENSLHESIKDIMPYASRNHMFKDKYYKLTENEVSKTITSHMKLDCNMYIHPKQSRGLSPREAARIQTFPDDFIFMGANNTWYAQIGNAVPVRLAKIIGKEILKNLKLADDKVT